jgi:hypothetical protein
MHKKLPVVESQSGWSWFGWMINFRISQETHPIDGSTVSTNEVATKMELSTIVFINSNSGNPRLNAL